MGLHSGAARFRAARAVRGWGLIHLGQSDYVIVPTHGRLGERWVPGRCGLGCGAREQGLSDYINLTNRCRFDGVTSMMYHHHGLQTTFTGQASPFFMSTLVFSLFSPEFGGY